MMIIIDEHHEYFDDFGDYDDHKGILGLWYVPIWATVKLVIPVNLVNLVKTQCHVQGRVGVADRE